MISDMGSYSEDGDHVYRMLTVNDLVPYLMHMTILVSSLSPLREYTETTLSIYKKAGGEVS